MSGYRELQVYERSYQAARAIYRITKEFPKEEQYGMVDQMRRASLSIALNIAEGYAKKESQQEFKRFLLMAMGSANEMEVLIDFAGDEGYISEETHEKAAKEYAAIGKMLNRMIQRVNEKASRI